jgi:hypothetical protein
VLGSAESTYLDASIAVNPPERVEQFASVVLGAAFRSFSFKVSALMLGMSLACDVRHNGM